MNEKFTLTGGVRIGKVNATYPFADLYVDKNVLKINASIVGNLVFQPQDIIELKPYKSIPIIGNGIKVIHRIEKYDAEIIFWTFKDPELIILEIKKTGFLNNKESILKEEDLKITKRQNQGGFPIKKAVVVIFMIVWNALLLSAFIPIFLHPEKKGFPFGIGLNIALGLALTALFIVAISKDFAKLILKEGRDFDDIKKFIYFAIFIIGILFISFTLLRFFYK
ncbi:hypothetical protein [Pseudomonas shirazensis]